MQYESLRVVLKSREECVFCVNVTRKFRFFFQQCTHTHKVNVAPLSYEEPNEFPNIRNFNKKKKVLPHSGAEHNKSGFGLSRLHQRICIKFQ